MVSTNTISVDSTTTVATTVALPNVDEVSSNAEQETPEQREQQILTHKMLARQLEYYFSTANLSRDTYLSTLRDLNDSYVPVSIIANFGKVQALAPYESALKAVVEAATDYSDLLEIVELDEEGKKITTDEEKKDESEANSVKILAVGPVSRKPIPVSEIQPVQKTELTSESPTSNSSPKPITSTDSSATLPTVQNTIIIREVPQGVEENTLRDLFAFDGCPSIESVREDLQNCWFVALDTSSKDDMFNVMMKLRKMKYPNGETVKARVKSSVSTSSSSPLTPNSVVFNPRIATMYVPQLRNNGTNANPNNNGGNSNSRKKRSSSNKGRSNVANSGNKSKNTQQNVSKRRSGKEESSAPNRAPAVKGNGAKNATGTKKKVTVKPPSMGETNFPSLPPTSEGDSKPFQVEKVPTDEELMRSCEKERHTMSGFSDSSSTATTSTASTPTQAPPNGVVTGGYAAALLKPAAPAPIVVKKKANVVKEATQKQQPSEKVDESARPRNNKKKESKNSYEKPLSAPEQPAVLVKPPVWGNGRSFADIVSA